jgi:hypothetical protein
MFRLRQIFYSLALSYFISSSYASFVESAHLVEKISDKITVKTIFSITEVRAEFKDKKNKALISDWDLVIAGISDVDPHKFLRDPNTPEVYSDLMKEDIPIIVATARWLGRKATFENYESYAKQMEKDSSVKISEQPFCKGKSIDLRTSDFQRGIYIQGITFTGSQKGLVVNNLLNHENAPTQGVTHYVYAEDDPTYIQQMIDVFKSRKEYLTILHFPSLIHTNKHTQMLKKIEHPEFSLSSRFSYYIRHNKGEEIKDFLLKTDQKKHIESVSSHQHLIDISYADSEIGTHVLNTVSFPFDQFDAQDLLTLSGLYYKRADLLKCFVEKIPNNAAFLSFMLTILMDIQPEDSLKLIEDFLTMTPHYKDLLPTLLQASFKDKDPQSLLKNIPLILSKTKLITEDIVKSANLEKEWKEFQESLKTDK